MPTNATATVTLQGVASAADLERVEKKLDRAIELLEVLAAKREGPILVNQSEASERLGVSRRTLFAWIKAGLIRTVDVDGSSYIRVSSLEEFAKEHERASPREAQAA